jgi:precorrin-6B C5,15-methyltransferase / cobalt-precorrin-6B C5,C15-methyltransferase
VTAPPVTVVGILDPTALPAGARAALAGADVVVGGEPQLLAADGLAPAAARRVVLGPLAPGLDEVKAARADGRRVCVLASGDPGFFGIVRALASALGPDALVVHPAPSSVAVAFARLGLP